METQVIRVSNSAYQYLKTYQYLEEKANQDKKSILDTLDFIIDVFKQVTVKIALEQSQHTPYMTCKKAFYEQNKHNLPEHKQRFHESKPEYMKIFFQENKEKFQYFKIAYLKQHKENKKAKLSEYNREYYLKHKND